MPVVFGEGPEQAELMIIGEGPGVDDLLRVAEKKREAWEDLKLARELLKG
jgi:uracil-DNA glycosylase